MAGAPGSDFDGYREDLGRASIVQILSNLRTYPLVREREAAGELSLHGAQFGIAGGGMLVLDQARGVLAQWARVASVRPPPPEATVA